MSGWIVDCFKEVDELIVELKYLWFINFFKY